MKACFYWGRRFVFLGHIMAAQLKEKYGINDFCAFVTARSGYNFLKNRTEIKYSQILLEEDIYASYKKEPLDLNYLVWLEKEYGIPNLWPYLDLDRILRYNLLLRAYPSDKSEYSHEEMMRILQVTAKAILKFFDEEKPDFIFFSAITNLSNLLLYEIARKKGIKTIIMYEARLGIQFAFSERYDTFSALEKAAAGMSPDSNFYTQAHNYLLEFQDKPKYYVSQSEAGGLYTGDITSARHHFSFLKPGKIGQSVGWFLKAHYDYLKDVNKDRNDYTTVKPWWEAWDKLLRKARILRGFNDLYDTVNYKEDFAYFALHAEPESWPVLAAPFYRDQKWLVAQVARSLPVHYKLYVKDHPRMLGLRPRAFYEELKKIPNVKLINPSVSSMTLAEKCKIVITVIGTAGWEAVLLKKPVIIFGNTPYSSLSAAKVCRAIVDLPYLIREHLENFKYSQEETIKLIAALYSESASADLTQMWEIEGAGHLEKKKKGLVPLVDLLAKKLGLV